MIISGEILKNQIIPSFFYDEDGRRIIDLAQEYFKNQNLSIKKILEKFDEANYLDDDFWRFLLKTFNLIFGEEIESPTDFSEKSLSELIEKFMIIRFDYLFNPIYSQEIINQEKLNEFLNQFKTSDTIEMKNDEVLRIIHPLEKETTFNLKPNQPTKYKVYPNLFIKIDKNKISFSSSQRHKILGLISKINDQSKETDEKILVDFDCEELQNFPIKVNTFFYDLKEEGFYFKNIKFDNNLLYFIFGFKKSGNFEHIINSESYINSTLDFLSLKELNLIYPYSKEDKEKEAKLRIEKIEKDFGSTNKSIRYNIYIQREKFIPENIKKEIIKKLKFLGLENEKSYNLPEDYYLNELFFNSQKSQKIINKINSINSENILLKQLKDENIIDGELNFDKELFNIFLENNFKKLIDKKSNKLNGEYFEIFGVDFNSKNNHIELKVKLINDDLSYVERNKVFLLKFDYSYSKDPLYPIIDNLDYSFLLTKILEENFIESLDFLFKRIKGYIFYEYSGILEKEATLAERWLLNYIENFKEMEKEKSPAILGGYVEKKLNIILKYLFRNYLPIGGAGKPDGFLGTEKLDKGYLIDSKQHKNIHQGEIDKVARYLLTYPKNESLPESKLGILIVCKNKLSSSLNAESRRKWKESTEFREENFNISFLSLEFILEIFSLYKTPKIQSRDSVRKEILEKVIYLAEFSKDYSKIEELTQKEEEILTGLKRKVHEFVNLPTVRMMQI